MALQLLLAAPIYSGFVTSWDAYDLAAYSYVWNMPENASSGDGLGQAITYAVASTFCEDLLPRFSEKSNILPFLVNCQLLRAALARSFATWADNHPYIKFLDISERCDVAEVWKCRGKVETQNCGCGVEVLLDVASKDPKPADRSASSNERAAYVRQRVLLGLVRTPAGDVHQALASIEADLFFNTDLCWYLDSTFCSWFHSFAKSKGDADSVRTLGTTLIFSIWAVALFVVVCSTVRFSAVQVIVARGTRAERLKRRALRARASVVKAMRRVSGTQGVDSAGSADGSLSSGAGASEPPRRLTRLQTISGKEGRDRQWRAAMLVLSRMSLPWMVVCSVTAITPVAFYTQLFKPCYDCYDFESAATHEIGHLLGLNHPDEFASHNRMVLAPMGPESCHDPLAFSTPPDTAPAADAPYSLMHSFTRHPSKVCMTEDDLHGLNFLYPTCDNAILPPASCHKSERNIGWLRFAMWVIFPVLIALAILLFLTGLIKHHQRKQLGSFALKLSDLKDQNSRLIEQMRVAVLKAEEEEEAQALAQQASNPSGGVSKQPNEAPSSARRKQTNKAQETLGLMERELAEFSNAMETMASVLHSRKRAAKPARPSFVSMRNLLKPRSPVSPPLTIDYERVTRPVPTEMPPRITEGEELNEMSHTAHACNAIL